MKQLFIILSILIGLPVYPQENKANFHEIDRFVQSVKFAAPEVLARELTTPYNTELEKVRSIFRWITFNIEYGIKVNYRGKRTNRYGQPEDTGVLKSLDERIAESVLERGLAVCDGYSRLFKTLCHFAGIRAELVTGYASTNSGKQQSRFRSNHTWNAVRIDSAWKLLDVTWASGYISWYGNNYVREFGEEYFLSSPEEFIRDHYPDDIRWTLLEEIPTIAEFRLSPYKQRTFIKYSITNYRPAKGLLEANLGDTLLVEIDVADAEKDKRIGGDPFLDTADYNTDNSALLIATGNSGNKLSYSYHVASPFIQWIYILYNDDVILRYRLVVKNQKVAFTF